MRIIFTDIDGVLNSRKTPNPRNLPYIVDAKLLKRFEELVARTDAAVVLTSTWRYDPAGLYSARRLGIPFVDVTPDRPERSRREEVLGWLHDHPEATRYAVIDDEDDQLDDLPLFQPSARIGLTDEIAAAVADYLCGRTDQDMRRSVVARWFQRIGAYLKGHEG